MGQRKTEITVTLAHQIAGFKKRSQARFNREHKTPEHYGEEGEYIVLGRQFSKERARAILKKELLEVNGFMDDEAESIAADMQEVGVGIGIQPDEGEPCSWLYGGEIADPLWQAWVVETGN